MIIGNIVRMYRQSPLHVSWRFCDQTHSAHEMRSRNYNRLSTFHLVTNIKKYSESLKIQKFQADGFFKALVFCS